MCSVLYMTSTYAAHIVTSEAEALGDPEIIVMTQPDETGASDPLVSYPLPADENAGVILHSNGWVFAGEPQGVETGYSIIDVQPRDWDVILKAVTYSRDVATAELDRCETGWRTLVRDAMNDPDTRKTTVAELAKISRERAYQIRDGRR